MSYEGYERVLCRNGHLHERSCYDSLSDDWSCPDCNEPQAWWEGVDQTNDAGTKTALQCYRSAQVEICEYCEHSKETAPKRYYIPNNSGHRKGAPLVPLRECGFVLIETGEKFDTGEELDAAYTALWEKKEAEHRAAINEFKSTVLEAVLEAHEPEEIILRDITDEEAKPEIKAYIEQHPGTDEADIHFELKLEFEQVDRICTELMEEGLVEWDEEEEPTPLPEK
jgi:hypothetical protein